MESKKLKNKLILTISIVALLVLSIISIFVGQYKLTIYETFRVIFNNSIDKTASNIIYNIRIPRTLTAIVIGAALSVAGITYQNVFRNSIASQDILGASSGACVGAALGILLDFNSISIQFLAFAFGCITILVTYFIANLLKMNKNVSLILSGVLVGGVMSSVLGLIKYLADPIQQLQSIVFWTMGDISGVSITQLLYVLPFLTFSLIVICTLRWKLNYFAIENHEAINLGINIYLFRNIFIGAATMLISASISIAGSIGWIGLAIPQLIRLLVGNNNEDTVILTMTFGSCFLLIVDIINRVISSAEIPISIISGLLGLPIFIICILIDSIRK